MAKPSRSTLTGRIPTKPNIQNIPIRTETGRIIREAYLKHLYGEKK